jgi:hypothetical protein
LFLTRKRQFEDGSGLARRQRHNPPSWGVATPERFC